MTEQEPAWLTKARAYIGFQEKAGNRGIQEFIDGAHTGEEGDPWCSIFANFALESVGIKGTRSPAANSFTESPLFVRQQSPQLGTICTFTRPGGNHVAFYTGIDKQGRLLVLGGNQGDKVGIEPHSTDTLTGYWWPKNDLAITPSEPKGPTRIVTPLDQKTIDAIMAAAANSALARYSWEGRERAPLGFIQGMAVAYAQALKRLAARDSVAMAMVQIVDGSGDVFDHYKAILTGEGMVTLGAPDIDRLRILYVILTGLAAQESSFGIDIGRDRSANNVTADTAEAGTWQQSRDSFAASGDPELPKLLAAYAGTAPDTVDAIFKRGITPNAGAFENFGDPDSDGFKFQALCKARPSIAVLFAAIGARTAYTHWGPLIHRAAEVVPAADALFRQVQTIVPLDGEVLPPTKLDDELFIAVVFVITQGDSMDTNIKAQMIAELSKPNPDLRSLLLQALGSATGSAGGGASGAPVTPIISAPSGGIDFSQIGNVLANPTVKKIFSGQPVALVELLPLIPTILAIFKGHPIPPPPSGPATVPDTTLPPASTGMSDAAFNWSTGIGGALTALLGSASGIMGTPIPGSPDFSLTGLLSFALPLIAGAFGIPAPIASIIGNIFKKKT